MGTDWEGILGSSGADLTDAYDGAVYDAMHQDHPRAGGSPGPWPPDPGDEERNGLEDLDDDLDEDEEL